MGKKAKHKGRKKDRREVDLADAAEAVRERGARSRLAPALWVQPDQVAAKDGVSGAPEPSRPVRAGRRQTASSRPEGAADPAELAARLASLGTLLQRLQGHGDADAEGLTRARLSALSVLVLGGARRLGDLAAAERVRPPTMSRLVDAMEADGWVTREPDPADGRSVIVRATPAGESHLASARSRQLAPLTGALADLDGGERRSLEAGTDVLERLLRTTIRQDEPLTE